MLHPGVSIFATSFMGQFCSEISQNASRVDTLGYLGGRTACA
uniref:Uncharacterized protein n=1 Tax=Arundo donax TaxID=35708 RepID=A0A0A8ZIU8_ARUDO